MTVIKFNRNVHATAMNKYVNQAGMAVERGLDRVQIMSVNAKDGNVTTQLKIEIPQENIRDLINVLKDMV